MRTDEHSFQIDGHKVEIERGPVGIIDRIAPEWLALCAEGPCNEPFYDPAWIVAAITGFEQSAPVSLITVRKDGNLRAVLPLVERSLGIGPVRLRWLRTPVNSHFPRFDIPHGAGDAASVARVLWRFLETRVSWDLLQFESAPAEGVAWRILELAAADGRETRLHRPDASPYIDATDVPEDVDQIISSLSSSNLRSQCRRAIKRLRARGQPRFQIVDHAAPVSERERALQDFYRMEASGWKGEAGTAIVSDPATQRFYDRIVQRAVETGSLAICELWCDDHLVSTNLDLIANGRMYELKNGYDESYRECSPGHLIKAYTVAAAPARGITILDNCGRSDAHKLAWTPHANPFATCFVGNTTLRGRLAWTGLFRVGPRARQRLQNVPLPKRISSMLG